MLPGLGLGLDTGFRGEIGLSLFTLTKSCVH